MDIYETERLRLMAEMFEGEEFPMQIEDLTAVQLAKVDAHAERFGHSVAEVLDSVLRDPVAYRAIVGKNPGRMDYYENALVEHLNSLDCVEVASKLPKAGPGAHHLHKGKIEVGPRKPHHKKSLDVYVQFTNGENLYVIHKYTREDGGAQDNQFREAKDALKEVATEDGSTKLNVAAILDGDYYSKARRTGPKRIDQAKAEFPNAVICTYSDFLEQTKKIWSK